MRNPTAPDFRVIGGANERVRVHNERNFPQAKLGNEINVPFLFNGHGDQYFFSHNDSVHIILFNLKKIKKFCRTEKAKKNPYSRMKVMTAKKTTLRTLYVHVVLNNVIFPQIWYDIVPYARHFLPVSFFPKC